MQAGLKQGRGRFRQGSTRSLKPIHASQAGLGSLLTEALVGPIKGLLPHLQVSRSTAVC
jgi:hypothetical protein